MTSREFFEMAREASRDAERCNRQLALMESRAHSLGGSSGERVASTPNPHRMSARIDAYVDREAALDRRIEGDYCVIERACTVLYGDSEGTRGLDVVQSPVWSDVLWWHYLDDAKWRAVGDAVGYSTAQCQVFARRAFEWMDEVKFMARLMH